MSFSSSSHQYSLSRRGKGETDLRPILASMDNLSVGARSPDTSPCRGSQHNDDEPAKPRVSCIKCHKGLHGASHSLSGKEGMGVCCRSCYKNSGFVREIYCQGCVHELDYDFCGTCDKYFCDGCFQAVELKDRQGNRFCSRRCAKARLKKTTASQNKKPRSKLEGPKQPKVGSSSYPTSGFVPVPFNLAQSASLSTTIKQKNQSTAIIPKKKIFKYACAWCTKQLTDKTTSRPPSASTDVGYYCNCNKQKIFCDGCAINHGDFCAGSCQKFSCRDCCPYDQWWNVQPGGPIFCRKECTPNQLRTSVFRRTLFDEDWEAEEHFRPLARRCRGVNENGERCKVTASHPCNAAKSLKQGDDFCTRHGGFNGSTVSDVDEDEEDYTTGDSMYDWDSSDEDGDYYFTSS